MSVENHEARTIVMREGSLPDDSLARAFVAGVAWWQFHKGGATIFPSERDEAEAEATRRYGEASRNGKNKAAGKQNPEDLDDHRGFE